MNKKTVPPRFYMYVSFNVLQQLFHYKSHAEYVRHSLVTEHALLIQYQEVKRQ